MCLDIDEDVLIPVAVVAAIVGIAAGFYFGAFGFVSDFIDNYTNTDDGSDFGLTTTYTVVGVGQEKEIVPEMCWNSTLDAMAWSCSDDSVLEVTPDPDSTYSSVMVRGLSPGTVTLTAQSGDHSHDCIVEVRDEAPANELRVYNYNSESRRYALLSGPGFEDGILSFSFNVNGRGVVTMGGYTAEMLSKNPSAIGGAYDFEKVVMTATDTSTNTVKASDTYDCTKAEYNLILNMGKLELGTRYDVDFHFYLFNDKDYHVTGSLVYTANDGTIDCTSVFKRPFAWRYGGSQYSFDLEFTYGDYYRYHLNALEGAYSWGGEIWNRSTWDNTSDFVRNNTILDEINANLESQYLAKKGSGASLTSMDYANFILAFAQIHWYYVYDHVQYTGGSEGEYFSYPMETLYSGCGDCDDTTVLTAALFNGAGFQAGTFSLPGHAMAAVHVDDFTMPEYDAKYDEYMAYTWLADGTVYYGCETTADEPVSLGLGAISLINDKNGNRYEDIDLHLV